MKITMQKTENRIFYTPKSQPSNLSTPYIDDLPNKFEYIEPIKPTKSSWYRNSKIHCIGVIALITMLIPLIVLTVVQNSTSKYKQTLNITTNETPNEIPVDPFSRMEPKKSSATTTFPLQTSEKPQRPRKFEWTSCKCFVAIKGCTHFGLHCVHKDFIQPPQYEAKQDAALHLSPPYYIVHTT